MKALSKIFHLVILFQMAEILMAEYSFMNKFVKVTCNSSGKTCVDPFCYITNNNQSFSSLSYGCTIKRAINDTNFTLKVFYKYENGYRQILKAPPMYWGQVVEGKNLNPFFKILASLIKKTAPSLFQKFPWIGKFGVSNLSVENEKYFSLFPKGEYKFDFFFGDDMDDFIFGAIVITSLTSSVKLDGTK